MRFISGQYFAYNTIRRRQMALSDVIHLLIFKMVSAPLNYKYPKNGVTL